MQAQLHLRRLQVRSELPLRQVRIGSEVLELIIRRDTDATQGIEPKEVIDLTTRATSATFYTDQLSPQQVEANNRIPALAGEIFFDAARSDQQHLAATFSGKVLTGFMIATIHGPDDHELDWLMVCPRWHGSGVAASLMNEGLNWLGAEQDVWLTVIQHNYRAIAFYKKFGFEVDRDRPLNRIVPSWIMRRAGTRNGRTSAIARPDPANARRA